MDHELKEILLNISNSLGRIEQRLDNVEQWQNSVEQWQNSADHNFQHIFNRLDILALKQDHTAKKLDDLQLDFQIAKRDIQRDIHKLTDEMDTVIEVLKHNELIPA